MHVFIQDEGGNRLGGRIEVDDGYLGGKHKGSKRGRGSPSKKPYFLAVSLHQGKPDQFKITRVNSFSKYNIKQWVDPTLHPNATVHSDALLGFEGIKMLGRTHTAYHQSQSPTLRDTLFKWINVIMGNLERYLR